MAMVNYPDPRLMSPWGAMKEGIQAGQMLKQGFQGGQGAQPSDAIIPDPGQYKPVDTRQFTQGVEKDIAALSVNEQKVKKAKLPTPEKEKEAMDVYVKSGVYKTPFISAMAEYGVSSKEISDALTAFQNGDPNAGGDINLLIQKTNSDPRVTEAIGGLAMQIKQAESTNKLQRAKVLIETLKDIDEYSENPRAYQGKTGVTSPQTVKVVNNRNNYLNELNSISPELYNKYLENEEKRKSSRGGSMKPFAFDYFDPKLKQWVNKQESAVTIQDIQQKYGLNNVKNFSSLNAQIGKGIYSRTEAAGQEDQRARINAGLTPRKKGTAANEQTWNKYVSFYKRRYNLSDKDAEDKAEQAMAEDGWR